MAFIVRDDRYTTDDLLGLMARLREPETGCPWDLAQTFETIAPCTLEECYELVSAIEAEDYGHVREELGDVLFQVVFYAQLGREEGRFEFADIVHGLVEKLVRRHPHVFADTQVTAFDSSDAAWVPIALMGFGVFASIGALVAWFLS